jgi:flagellar biosynthetic protein FlhB
MADKSEAPTSRRKAEARSEGNVVRSQELNAAAIMLVSVYLITNSGKDIAEAFKELMIKAITELPTAQLTQPYLMQMFYGIGMRVAPSLGLILVGLLFTGVSVTLAQTRFLWSSKNIGFQFKRLNPLNGLKRIFSTRGLFEVAKALLKLLLIGWIAYGFLSSNIPQVLALVQYDLPTAATTVVSLVAALALRVAETYLILAVADYAYQYWSLMRNLRMSKDEIKEEFKSSEGNPFLKSRIRSQMRRIARGRMMSNVPKATVIVTNPTHLAIAVEYREGMNAPKILAKGAHLTAQRIVSIAKAHSIPVVQNIPLARAIYKRVDIDQEISPDLYVAMAEVLSYVYRLRGLSPAAARS